MTYCHEMKLSLNHKPIAFSIMNSLAEFFFTGRLYIYSIFYSRKNQVGFPKKKTKKDEFQKKKREKNIRLIRTYTFTLASDFVPAIHAFESEFICSFFFAEIPASLR